MYINGIANATHMRPPMALYVCHRVTLYGNKPKLNTTPLTCSGNPMAESAGIEQPLNKKLGVRREAAGI